MNILLFGPPGSGKGTQSSLLVKNKSFLHLSTGDLFRANIKNQTKTGLEAKSYIDAGKLVPDDVVIRMVEAELSAGSGKSYILDGFPRTVVQANALKELLSKYKLSLEKAVFLEVAEEELLTRLTGRRTCPKCNSVFHISANPPKKLGVCDNCGGELVQRKDDTEQVISTRLKEYAENTKPLKEFYRTEGILRVVKGSGKTEDVFKGIVSALES